MARKLTTKEFIERAKDIHDNLYDYSKVDYNGAHIKVEIICRKHGSFFQTPSNHCKSYGCPKCKIETQRHSTQDFIKKAISIHNNRYVYSNVKYVNSHSKVEIICPEHGSFFQKPYVHLNGHGCPTCGETRKLTTKEFIEKAISIHNDIYDYSKVQYKNTKTKVEIVCRKHGSFFQFPNAHLNGQGCPKCAIENRKLTTKEFIKKARNIHGDLYDYSKVQYEHSKSKVEIICPRHGSFFQKPNDHLNGKKCPECAKEKNINSMKLTTLEFIKKAKLVHGDLYDYSKVNYVNAHSKVEIVCRKHGSFSQKPHNHLNGSGCPECAKEKIAKSLKHSTQEFIEKARDIHGNQYDYSKVQYVNAHIKVEIICPEHGSFIQKPNSHLNGQGCPKCPVTISKPEQEIADYIISLGFEIIQSHRNWNKKRPQLEIDIFIPSLNLGFEFNGSYWHSKKPKGYHKEKTLLALENDIRLIHIWEEIWMSNPERVKRMIEKRLVV